MRKSVTEGSPQLARSGNQKTNSKRNSIIIGLEGVLESISRKEKSMNRNLVTTITIGIFALIAVLWAAQPGRGADVKTYPEMAPLDQYLMADRDAEIALARTAAPPSISSNATVMVLGSHGYETAVKGKNGFVCVVERAWMGAFDSPEFWNAKDRSPSCFNPQAARSVLPITDHGRYQKGVSEQ